MVRRNTIQKACIYDALALLGHASTEELIDYLKKNNSSISLATIYRNLTILMEENMVKKIKLIDKEVYETVKQRHFHCECRICKNVIDIPSEMLELNKKSINSINEFIVDDYEINFYGICEKCKTEEIKNEKMGM